MSDQVEGISEKSRSVLKEFDCEDGSTKNSYRFNDECKSHKTQVKPKLGTHLPIRTVLLVIILFRFANAPKMRIL